ncbi:LacI family DNA-binding transcriptional regulator [Actinopolymorpha alba]|uniref:LacI family DNA-binding transcriptional regulator n=1 Tax=Actinopolymorpha alba TaxID=533267 RepID=UPI0003810F1E|nr:LacI family DNA-binding transcriptional regulator [Actinopolymorpha alba]
MAKRHKATARDVARLAGVSRSAVSMVLNGHGDKMISAEKQDAIRSAAAELHYAPDRVARSLRNRQTHTLGVVTDWIATSAHAGALLAGATDAAMAAGYVLLIIDTQNDSDRERTSYATLADRQVDGWLFAAMSMTSYPVPDQFTTMPGLLANALPTGRQVAAVVADEVSGGGAAAQVLVDHGHRRIAALTGTDGIAVDLRNRGLRSVVDTTGVECRMIPAGWDITAGYQAGTQVLDAPDRPTGILCANDRVALGVIMAAYRLGLQVPDDVSVVGYDDDPNVAPVSVPGITTLALPHREIGEQAVRLLLRAVEEDDPAPVDTVVELPCRLIKRGSVSTPR